MFSFVWMWVYVRVCVFFIYLMRMNCFLFFFKNTFWLRPHTCWIYSKELVHVFVSCFGRMLMFSLHSRINSNCIYTITQLSLEILHTQKKRTLAEKKADDNTEYTKNKIERQTNSKTTRKKEQKNKYKCLQAVDVYDFNHFRVTNATHAYICTLYSVYTHAKR